MPNYNILLYIYIGIIWLLYGPSPRYKFADWIILYSMKRTTRTGVILGIRGNARGNVGIGKLGIGKLGIGKLGIGKLGIGKLGIGIWIYSFEKNTRLLYYIILGLNLLI